MARLPEYYCKTETTPVSGRFVCRFGTISERGKTADNAQARLVRRLDQKVNRPMSKYRRELINEWFEAAGGTVKRPGVVVGPVMLPR